MKQSGRQVKKSSEAKKKQQSTNFIKQGLNLPKYLFLDTETICPKCNKTMMISSAGDSLLTGSKFILCKHCGTEVSITVE